MFDKVQDRRKYFRIPMVNLIYVSQKINDIVPFTILELSADGANIAKIELSRETTTENLQLCIYTEESKVCTHVPLNLKGQISLKFPLIEEPKSEMHVPMVRMIRMQLGSAEPLPTMLVDLSASGARIMSQCPLLANEKIILRIPLFDEEMVEISGNVIWTRKMELMKEYNFGVEYMLGIKFSEPSDKIKEFILKHTGRC